MKEKKCGLCEKGDAHIELSSHADMGCRHGMTCEKSESSSFLPFGISQRFENSFAETISRNGAAFVQHLSIFFENMRKQLRTLYEQKLLKNDNGLFLFYGLFVVPLLSFVIVGGVLTIAFLLRTPRKKKFLVIRKRRYSLCCWRSSKRRALKTRKWTFFCATFLIFVHVSSAFETVRDSGQNDAAPKLPMHDQTSQVENSLQVCQVPTLWDPGKDVQHPLDPLLDSYVLLDELGHLTTDIDSESLMQIRVHPGVFLWSCTVHRDSQLTVDAHTLQSHMVQSRTWTQTWVVQPGREWIPQTTHYPLLWDPRDCIRCAYQRRSDVPQSPLGRGPYLIRDQPSDPTIFNALQFIYLMPTLAASTLAVLVHRYQGNHIMQRFALTLPRAAGGLPVDWFFDQLHPSHQCRQSAWCRITSRGKTAWWHERIILESLSFATMEEVITDPLDPGATCGVQVDTVTLVQMGFLLLANDIHQTRTNELQTDRYHFEEVLNNIDTFEDELALNLPHDQFDFDPLQQAVHSWHHVETDLGLQQVEPGQTLRVHRPWNVDGSRSAQTTFLSPPEVTPTHIIEHIQAIWTDLGQYPSFERQWKLSEVEHVHSPEDYIPKADFEYVLRAEMDLTLGTDSLSAILVEITTGTREYGLMMNFAVASIKVLTAGAFCEHYLPAFPLSEDYEKTVTKNEEPWHLEQLTRLWHGDLVQVVLAKGEPTNNERVSPLETRRERSRSPYSQPSRHAPTRAMNGILGKALALSPGQGTYRRARIHFELATGSTVLAIRNKILEQWPRLGDPTFWAPLDTHHSFRTSPFLNELTWLLLANEFHVVPVALRQRLLTVEVISMQRMRLIQTALIAIISPQFACAFDIMLLAGFASTCESNPVHSCEYWHNGNRLHSMEEIEVRSGDYLMAIVRPRAFLSNVAVLMSHSFVPRRIHGEDFDLSPQQWRLGHHVPPNEHRESVQPPPPEQTNWNIFLWTFLLTCFLRLRCLRLAFLFVACRATTTDPNTLWWPTRMNTLDELGHVGQLEVVFDIPQSQYRTLDLASSVPAAPMRRIFRLQDHLGDVSPSSTNVQCTESVGGQGLHVEDRTLRIPFSEEELLNFVATWQVDDLKQILPMDSYGICPVSLKALLDTPFETNMRNDFREIRIFVDGSFFKDDDTAGWAFVVVAETDEEERILGWSHSAIFPQNESAGEISIPQVDSHRAELFALFHAGWFAHCMSIHTDIDFVFDNVAAGKIAEGAWNSQTTGPLADATRTIHQWLKVRREETSSKLSYTHVKSHTSHPWNELADVLAKWAAKNGVIDHPGQAVELMPLLTGPCPLLPQMVWAWKVYKQKGDYPDVCDNNIQWQTMSVNDFDRPKFVVTPVIEEVTKTKRPQCSLTLVSYNVSTLSDSTRDHFGAKAEFLRAQFEHLGVSVAALQETRASSPLFLDTPNFFRFISASSGGLGGTELWFAKGGSTCAGVRWCKDDFVVVHTDPELLCIIVKTAFGHWGFLSGHAPHMGRSTNERSVWWRRFGQIVKKFRNCKLVFWLGDFNAQIAEPKTNIIGDLPDFQQNCNGDQLSVAAENNNMWLPATYFEHHWGPIQTWFSARCPAGKRLDYIAVPQHLPYVKIDSWVENSLDAGQVHLDHIAIALKIVFELPKSGCFKKKQLSIDRTAVKDPKNRETIQQILNDIDQPNWNCDVHTHYDLLSSQIFEAVVNKFPSRRTRPRRPYISDTSWFIWQQKQMHRRELHSLNLLSKQRFLKAFFQAWRQPLSHDLSLKRFKETHKSIALAIHQLYQINRDLKTQLGADKKRHFDQLAIDANAAEPAFVWEKLKRLGIGRIFRRAGRNVLPMLENEEGNLATTIAEAQKIWRSHAEMLEFGKTTPREEVWQKCVKQQIESQFDDVSPEFHLIPTILMLEKACRRVQPGKATGFDGIVGELLHAFPEHFAELLHPLTTKIFVRKMEPVSLKGGKLVRAWKGRGSVHQVENYRGLMISNHIGKVIHGAFRKLLLPSFELRTLPLQLGGKRRALVSQAAQIVRSFTSWSRRACRPSAVIFFDIRTAFYRVVRPLVAHLPHLHQQIITLIERFGLPPTALQELYRIMDGHTAMREASAHPFLENMMGEFNQGTWFETPYLQELSLTEAGTRPGDPLADITFSFLFSKVLHKAKTDLEDIGVIFDLQWSGVPTIFPSNHDTCLTTSIFESIWADDLAVMLHAPGADSLVKRVAVATQVVTDLCLDHGLEPNMGVGKTEVILAVRGKGSVAVRKQVYNEANPVVHFESRHWSNMSIRVVTSYKHLGGRIDHTGNDKAEILARVAYASSIFNKYRKNLFQSPHIHFEKKLSLMTPLVMSVLQYAMGTWSNYSEAVIKTASARVISLYKRLFRGVVAHDQICTMSHEEVLAKTQLASFDDLLHINRLRHLGSLVREAPAPLWAMLEHEQTWFSKAQDSLEWLWAQLQTSIDLSSPLTDWDAWRNLMRNQPKRWTGLIARASKHAILQRTLKWSSKHWHSVILEAMVPLGLQPDWLQTTQVAPTSNHLCAPCGQRFQTAASWAVHAFRKHNRVHYIRYYIDHTVCKSCTKEYWSQARLHRHLRYQRECRHFYMKYVPRGDLQPGLNSKFFNKNEPPVLSPPVDAVCDDFELRLRYGCDPEAEEHPPMTSQLADLLECDLQQYDDYSRGQQGLTMWSLVTIVHGILCSFPIPFAQIALTWRSFYRDWHELVDEDSPVAAVAIWKHVFDVVQWRFCAAWLVPQPPQIAQPNDHRDAPYHWLMSAAPARWGSPQVHVPRVLSERFVIHFFSGRRRKGDLQERLEALPTATGFLLHVLSVDLVYGKEADLLDAGHRKRWLNIFASGVVLAFWAGPPCETWSTARHNALAHINVRPVRSAVSPWGLMAMAVREARQVLVANLLMWLSLLCLILQATWQHYGMLEHPQRPRQPERASIWRTALWKIIQQMGCLEVGIYQGLYGARSAKPTCLSFTPARSWIPQVLDKHRTCESLPKEVSIGKNSEGSFWTSQLKEYPTALNSALADTFHTWSLELATARTEAGQIPSDVIDLFRQFEVLDEASMGPDYVPPTARLISPA